MKHFTEFKNPAFFFSIGYLQFQTVDLRRSKSKMEAAETLYLELVNVHLLFQFLHYQNFIIFILTYSSIQNWKKTWSKKTKIYRQKKAKFASLESKEDFERQKWKKKKNILSKLHETSRSLVQHNPRKSQQAPIRRIDFLRCEILADLRRTHFLTAKIVSNFVDTLFRPLHHSFWRGEKLFTTFRDLRSLRPAYNFKFRLSSSTVAKWTQLFTRRLGCDGCSCAPPLFAINFAWES